MPMIGLFLAAPLTAMELAWVSIRSRCIIYMQYRRSERSPDDPVKSYASIPAPTNEYAGYYLAQAETTTLKDQVRILAIYLRNSPCFNVFCMPEKAAIARSRVVIVKKTV